MNLTRHDHTFNYPRAINIIRYILSITNKKVNIIDTDATIWIDTFTIF